MDEDIAIVIGGTITVLGGLAILLTAWWLWLRNRAARAASPDELAQLKRAVEDMRLELDAVHRGLADGQQELHERLDFAERLLAQKQPDRLPHATSE